MYFNDDDNGDADGRLNLGKTFIRTFLFANIFERWRLLKSIDGVVAAAMVEAELEYEGIEKYFRFGYE